MIVKVPIEIDREHPGLKATLRGLEEIERRATGSVRTLPDEPEGPSPGDLLEASHWRLVGRIRKEQSE
jgi:hypothetical protein